MTQVVLGMSDYWGGKALYHGVVNQMMRQNDRDEKPELWITCEKPLEGHGRAVRVVKSMEGDSNSKG